MSTASCADSPGTSGVLDVESLPVVLEDRQEVENCRVYILLLELHKCLLVCSRK